MSNMVSISVVRSPYDTKLEDLTNALYLDKNRDTVQYLAVMDSLCVQAEPPAGSIDFLNRALKEI
ncbi:MAG: hypothetical protein ACRDS9_22845 [Pseudonocardiaceae bacterium]